MYIDKNTLHEVPFQGMSVQKKNAFMTLNRFQNKNDLKVFFESKHSLPRLENVKNY